VVVEEINLDGARYSRQDRLRIPAGTHSIGITYSAIALTNPESIRFRYRLDGVDRDWIDADSRRIALYNNLKPGTHTFTVSASAGGGQWKQAPVLVLEQVPFVYQTTWFMILATTTVILLGVFVYRARVHRAVDRIQARFQERMDERTRIARDLHDTVLQSFQGVLLKFSAVKYSIRDRPDEAEETLERLLAQGREAIVEGRNAVQGLRASTVVSNDLARAVTALGEELLADRSDPHNPHFGVQVEGAPRDFVPVLRDEVYLLAGEALRNAFHHAEARRIEVHIHYDHRELRMLVKDDGKGIDPQILSAGGRTGHHGLAGMHERAKLAGGKLALTSKPDSGTEVDLTIPASVAYTKPVSTGR
jgi:signal transduction histidine kinase